MVKTQSGLLTSSHCQSTRDPRKSTEQASVRLRDRFANESNLWQKASRFQSEIVHTSSYNSRTLDTPNIDTPLYWRIRQRVYLEDRGNCRSLFAPLVLLRCPQTARERKAACFQLELHIRRPGRGEQASPLLFRGHRAPQPDPLEDRMREISRTLVSRALRNIFKYTLNCTLGECMLSPCYTALVLAYQPGSADPDTNNLPARPLHQLSLMCAITFLLLTKCKVSALPVKCFLRHVIRAQWRQHHVAPLAAPRSRLPFLRARSPVQCVTSNANLLALYASQDTNLCVEDDKSKFNRHHSSGPGPGVLPPGE